MVFNLKTHLYSFCSPFCYQVWSHADYPLIEIGRMTLDRNPTNYFAEIEQLAFAPSHMIPGKAFYNSDFHLYDYCSIYF